MRVVIVGAGEVGYQIARVLSAEDIDVVMVDKSKEKLKRITEDLDIAVIEGEGGSPSVLNEAGADRADMLLAVTDFDETNMIACLVAKVMLRIPRNIARIRNLEYIDNETLLESLGINPAISPEVESAKAVVRLLEIPYATDVEDFEDGKVKIIGFKIPPDSKLIGKSLENLNLLKPKILIGVIERGYHIIIPSGKDIISKDDVIFLSVRAEDVESVCQSVGGDVQPVIKNVMMVGGGRMGYYIAKTMEQRNVNVKIIEMDTERCKFLLKSLKKSVILHGDGSDQKLLLEENIDDMDVFAALSNNEELNIMASLLAKSLGAKKVITVVNRTDYLPLANNLGIEVVLSPRLITADTILRYVRKINILSLTTVAEGRAEILEAQVWEGPLIDKTLNEVKLPKSSLIGAIIRDDHVIIPSGSDRISKGDKLIIFTLKESIRQVEKLLQ